MLRCLAASVCLAFAGCVYLPYCLPEVDHVADIKIPTPSEGVHVFRVDGRESSWHGGGIGDGPGMGLEESHELVRLDSLDHKTVAAQWAIGVETGSLTVLPVGWNRQTTKHTLAVRFYRPGYATIEIKPGDEQKEFTWKAVADVAGLEKAVDDLIVDTETRGGIFQPHLSWKPASGANSPGHRKTLLFCADEYDRIRSSVTGSDADAVTARTRLIEKAKRLRDLVDGK